jgi:hypothetical protein
LDNKLEQGARLQNTRISESKKKMNSHLSCRAFFVTITFLARSIGLPLIMLCEAFSVGAAAPRWVLLLQLHQLHAR